jgi:hypothetical protein
LRSGGDYWEWFEMFGKSLKWLGMVGLNSPFPWPHPPSDGYPAEALPVQLL